MVPPEFFDGVLLLLSISDGGPKCRDVRFNRVLTNSSLTANSSKRLPCNANVYLPGSIIRILVAHRDASDSSHC